jgi:hypothetical protein
MLAEQLLLIPACLKMDIRTYYIWKIIPLGATDSARLPKRIGHFFRLQYPTLMCLCHARKANQRFIQPGLCQSSPGA